METSLSLLPAPALVPLLAEVSASAYMVPMRARTPAVAESAAAPRSLLVMTVPLP
ncbi:hypothetical protein [Streptomyces guryensis]|uniref:Uncharacterized protein n=1 Tax=Streptomyces guryensis TaxID=2886947 RepID=A0A9Q3VQI3_9ACTN|nr:hypothetical protein [Streptomyces guryensis]MCD9876804.1 hypothetical protein [Streptomyces guryensis]